MMDKKYTEGSKFLSYVLRHQPEAVGLALDREGWVPVAELIAAASRAGKRLDRQAIDAIVATNDKKRFALSEDGLRIRAVQGHSTSGVDIGFVEKTPPALLFHGTATRFMDAIREEGLRPGLRHYVHLSQDERTASAVGKRHGKPVVLTVRALRMHEQGLAFYQADNGVWLTHAVPVQFIEFGLPDI